MYEHFIKEWLLSKQFRVYSVIVETYFEKLELLKPFLFRKWLAKELQIGEEEINLSSLNSALSRYRSKLKKQDNRRIERKEASQIPLKPFFFSKDDVLPQKQNFTEH